MTRETNNPGFHGLVHELSRFGEQPVHGREVDDGSTSCLTQMRDREARGAEHRFQPEVQTPIPFLFADSGRIHAPTTETGVGVVDHDIQPAPHAQRAIDHQANPGLSTDVAFQRFGHST